MCPKSSTPTVNAPPLKSSFSKTFMEYFERGITMEYVEVKYRGE